ncbi:uncharacterized protein [Anabrus simplex]|uniref:uncharacterized protein isoform X3 n=1 Tax=Anabrus simplex TaxID=316456 RepID=UPI0035A38191
MKCLVVLLVLAAGCCSASFLTNAMFEDYNPVPTLNDTDNLLWPCIQRKDYKALHRTMSAISEYHNCYQKGLVILEATLRAINGNSLPEFFSALCSTMSVNATECAREKWQCIRSHLQGAYRTGYGFLQLERFLLTPEGCRSRKEAVACLYRTVDFCDGDSAAGVIDGFFNSSMAVAMPCFSEESLQWANH